MTGAYNRRFGMVRTPSKVSALASLGGAMGMLMLFAVIVISVFKPWGRTPIGARWQRTLVRANAKVGDS